MEQFKNPLYREKRTVDFYYVVLKCLDRRFL